MRELAGWAEKEQQLTHKVKVMRSEVGKRAVGFDAGHSGYR